MIYDLCLTHQTQVEVRHRHIYEIRQADRAVTQVASLVRKESLPVYYSINTFVFSSMADLLAWLRSVGNNCQHLRTVRILDRVLEGQQWSNADKHLLRSNLTRFDARIRLSAASAGSLHLTADHEVNSVVKEVVCSTLQPVRAVMAHFGKYNLEVLTTVAHCEHCMKGCFVRCCVTKRCCMQS